MLSQLPRTVIVLSLVSFLNDAASDMVIPLLPVLLATHLAAGPMVLGFIEGVADALASLLKLWSGRRSDVLGGKRKAFAVAGYSLSNIARPLLALAGSWVTLLVLRSIDRIGKGIRSAPRDAMIADSTPAALRGTAFGFHRALDNAGAVLGALCAAAVVWLWSASAAQIILWSAVPGALCVLLLVLAATDPPHTARPAGPAPPLRWALLSPTMRRYLLVLLLFTFARISETFIVLRGHELKFSLAHVLVLWAGLNLAKAVGAAWGGVLADRLTRSRVLFISWAVSALMYAALGLAGSATTLWIVTIAYGLFAGLSEGAERAAISDLAHPEERGTAFGWYNMMLGLAAIPAGTLFGWIWMQFGARAAWWWAASSALAAALLLRWLLSAPNAAARARESV